MFLFHFLETKTVETGEEVLSRIGAKRTIMLSNLTPNEIRTYERMRISDRQDQSSPAHIFTGTAAMPLCLVLSS